jgi:hypothetical protein
MVRFLDDNVLGKNEVEQELESMVVHNGGGLWWLGLSIKEEERRYG